MSNLVTEPLPSLESRHREELKVSHSCQCLHFIRFTHGKDYFKNSASRANFFYYRSWIRQCMRNRHLCKPRNAFVREELEQINQQEHLVLAASLPSLLHLLFRLNCTSLGSPAKSPAQGYPPPLPPPLNLPMKDSCRVQGLRMIKALTRGSEIWFSSIFSPFS